jgi:CubicO group peptidase (beta-lactamase class C family)
MRWITRAFAFAVALAPAVAAAASCGTPTDLRDGWTAAAPEQEGLDPASICGIGPRLEGLKEAQPHGVVIARHGRLIYEHYFTGKDWRLSMSLGDVSFDAGTNHDIRSISKKVTSLLIGIALDRGLLTDLDAPVFSFFPEYDDLRTPEKDRMTLRHLLTMSSGLAWDETNVAYTNPSNSYWQMGIAPAPIILSWRDRSRPLRAPCLTTTPAASICSASYCVRSPGSGSTSSPRKPYAIRSGSRIGSGRGPPGLTRLPPLVAGGGDQIVFWAIGRHPPKPP